MSGLRYLRKNRRLFNEINIVPYVDVTLVLLLVFMISAPLIEQGVEVELPSAQAQKIDSITEEPIVISLDAQSNLYLNLSDKPRTPIASADLLASVLALKQLNPQLPVMLRADRKVLYSSIMRVMTVLQKAGIDSVGLMTDPS